MPNVYGKYPNSEEGTPYDIWKNKDLEAGRAVKDCHSDDKKAYLIEKLKYQFTVLILKDMLTIEDKEKLKAQNIAVLEINYRKNTDLMETYELGVGAAYLITPDQYILGRWKNFTTDKAIDLMNVYLSGVVYATMTLQKTEQEIIDEDVASQLKILGACA